MIMAPSKFPIKVNIQGKGPVTLQDRDYLAAGGQGVVCRKGGVAYKIYHDPSGMIPVDKIKELNCLIPLGNVLVPEDVILDSKDDRPIGFTMKFIDQTEFLCRIFSKGFRQDNQISPQMVVDLVKSMQMTLNEIHKNRILVVDYNEMNFLTSGDFRTVYNIDCDSYQTPTHRANALMESVRDRIAPKGQFNEGTDWFSFAVVTFQMYMGYHPYRKGKHPKYKPGDWSERMDKNVSCFDKDVQLDDVWKDFSGIPKPHLDWYINVFRDKGRAKPPLPDAVSPVPIVQAVIVQSTANFDVRMITELPDRILNAYSIGGLFYLVTARGVYLGTRKVSDVPKGLRISLAGVFGADPVLAISSNQSVTFQTFDGTVIGNLAADSVMHCDGRIYSVRNGRMTESWFDLLGKKVHHLTKVVANVFEPATKLFYGVAVQDILGTCWIAYSPKQGSCANVHIKELDQHRVIDAQYQNGTFIAISEIEGKYFRTVLNTEQTTIVRQTGDVQDVSLNATTLKNGMTVLSVSDDQIELFKTPIKARLIDKVPFTVDMKLVNDSTSVYFINGNKIFKVSLKN